VLELFESGREEMTLSEIARNMDTAPSGIYAIVSTLEDLGCLTRNPDTKQYRLGLKILELASRLIGSLDVRDEARATLRRLAADHRANSHLAVLYDDEVLYIDTEITAATFVLPEIIGRRAPSYCTALGKALLAYNPDAADRVLSAEPYPAMTSRTITTGDKLRRQLLQVVERGHAVDREEFHEGIVCIAAPIRNFRGEVAAALSVSIASSRLKQESLSGFVESVMRGAREVSERMGLAVA
jgi:DNA-binding IclR family transcriptional regulator